MTATFLGVRHHSPACARLVRRVIRELRPAHVLVEGPSDMNDRMDELLLGHRLPIAVFSSYRDAERHHTSWGPLCAHSPEWVALTEGRRHGAEVRFIDLPAWHEAMAGWSNRYADAERRHAAVVERLCAEFAVDNVDALWDHLFEIGSAGGPHREPGEIGPGGGPHLEPGDVGPLETHLAAYFDLVRGDAGPSEEDAAREAYMARWVAAAIEDAQGRPVVVVTGGLHRPALVRHLAATRGGGGWPEVPALPPDAVGGSYLVPFSFRRMDAFDGYQAGMPSPVYYQALWEGGAETAARRLLTTVVGRLRARHLPVSTADLVAARTQALGLARLRGHVVPARVDVLDGLVSALVTDPLEVPVPWSLRARLPAGTDPVVVEMVAALSGDVVGSLHPSTPLPPLVGDVTREFDRWGLPGTGAIELELTAPEGLGASRVLHRLRVLRVPGTVRQTGPVLGGDPLLTETWELTRPDTWLPALIEAGSYGGTLRDAAAAALGDRLCDDVSGVASVLVDALLCGLTSLAAGHLEGLPARIALLTGLDGLGDLLTTALGLWRHDRLFGSAAGAALAAVVDAATRRVLWLVEGVRGSGPAPADDHRLQALVGVRDAVVHAPEVLGVDREAVVAVALRCTAPDRPPDLRGAAVGLVWTLGSATAGAFDEVRAAVRLAGHPEVFGDFLSGLFALAREVLLEAASPDVLALVDEVVGAYGEEEFLRALPALRLSFGWFPPREREHIARTLLRRHGTVASTSALVRLDMDPVLLTRAREVEARVAAVLKREALLARTAGAGSSATGPAGRGGGAHGRT